MRKPVYLAVLGISIVVAAVSLGVTMTRFLGLLAYSPKGSAQAAATRVGPGVPAAPPEEWNNLFAPGDGMNLASRLPAIDAKAGSPGPHSNFVLVGTIVSTSPAARRAILWTNGMKEPKAFRENEEIEPGAFLASVERDVAWITRGSERVKLEIVPVGSHARPTQTGAHVAASPEASEASRTFPFRRTAPRPGAAASRKKPPGADDEETSSPEEPRRRSRRNRR